ncbi:DUF724 domain-containing protein 8-like, partial [Helianthus annuus]|uniref:DUF724 domain-containing protein 8-like n=1 Tax=Helianthus annuus TaxID=4232 RepID=UPI0016533ADD
LVIIWFRAFQTNIKLNDPVDIINDNLEVLVDLEAHGFDVDLIRCRLNELLSLKSKAGQHEDTLKELEKRSYEKLVIEKEMDQLKAEMEKLQEKMMHAEIMRKAKEEELVRLQSNLHPDFTQINDWELAFGKLAATPLHGVYDHLLIILTHTKMMHAETLQKAKEEEIVRMQSNLHPDFTQINDWELAFRKLVATPFGE